MAWSGSKRCRHCGGLNAADAAWCGQCLKPLGGDRPTEPSAPAPMPAGRATDPPVAGPAPGVALGTVREGSRGGIFTLSPDGATWTCSGCGAVNTIQQDPCRSCGRPLTAAMASPPSTALSPGPPGLLDRFARAFRLIQASLSVLASDPELLVLPLVALAAGLLLAGTFFRGATSWFLVPETRLGASRLPMYVTLGVFYYLTSFVGIFCNAAVVAAAMTRLEGGDPTVGGALRAAARKARPIAVWALISATVMLLLSMAERAAERSFLGRSMIRVAGVAWSAITFFVVPVILFEPLGAVDGMRRSARLFRQRWGETLVGEAGIGLALGLAAMPVLFMLAWSIVTFRLVFLVISAVLLLAIAIFGATLSGIFNAALYRFATAGETPYPFDRQDLEGTFTRPTRGLSRGT